LEVIDAHSAQRTLGKVEDFAARRWSSCGDQIHLIVAVEVNLVGAIPELATVLQLHDYVRVPSGGHEGREPVQPGNDTVLDLSGGHAAGPANDARHAKTTFQGHTLGTGERSLPAIGPGEVLRSVVRGEHNDGVIVETLVL